MVNEEKTPLLGVQQPSNRHNDHGAIEPAEENLNIQEDVDESVSKCKVFLGYFLVVWAGCSFTGANVAQKIICPSLNFWSLFLIRSLTQMAIMGIGLAVQKIARRTSPNLENTGIPTKIKFMIFLQGFFGGLLLLSIFVAVKQLPLGNASAIFFCTPVATFVFATVLLGEPLKGYRFVIIFFMLIGVTLITRPSFFGFSQDVKTNDQSDSTLGYIAAIMVPILAALVSILTRRCRSVLPTLLMFWFAVGCLVCSLVGGYIGGQLANVFNLTLTEWAWTIFIVALGMVGNLSYTFAVKWVSPTKANVFRSFEVILNYALQICLEHLIFHPTQIIGIVFLLLAVLATAFEQKVISMNLHPWI
jgi:drug/metabolite transporter (DMT)-like permease